MKPTTFAYMANCLARHHIHVVSSLEGVGKFLYDSSGVWTRTEQAALCGVSIRSIFYILRAYADDAPPRTIRAKRYA